LKALALAGVVAHRLRASRLQPVLLETHRLHTQSARTMKPDPRWGIVVSALGGNSR
jgi:hypothetical protein